MIEAGPTFETQNEIPPDLSEVFAERVCTMYGVTAPIGQLMKLCPKDLSQMSAGEKNSFIIAAANESEMEIEPEYVDLFRSELEKTGTEHRFKIIPENKQLARISHKQTKLEIKSIGEVVDDESISKIHQHMRSVGKVAIIHSNSNSENKGYKTLYDKQAAPQIIVPPNNILNTGIQKRRGFIEQKFRESHWKPPKIEVSPAVLGKQYTEPITKQLSELTRPDVEQTARLETITRQTIPEDSSNLNNFDAFLYEQEDIFELPDFISGQDTAPKSYQIIECTDAMDTGSEFRNDLREQLNDFSSNAILMADELDSPIQNLVEAESVHLHERLEIMISDLNPPEQAHATELYLDLQDELTGCLSADMLDNTVDDQLLSMATELLTIIGIHEPTDTEIRSFVHLLYKESSQIRESTRNARIDQGMRERASQPRRIPVYQSLQGRMQKIRQNLARLLITGPIQVPAE